MTEIRLKDMIDKYGDNVLYTVKDIFELENVKVSITEMEGDDVCGHSIYTRGHRHKNPYPELYVWLYGRGIILLKDKYGNTEYKELDEDSQTVEIPADRWHRVMNMGDSALEFLSIYHADSEPIYGDEKW